MFYDATHHFSGTHLPTSNVFFSDVCKIQLKLNEWEKSDIDFLRNIASPMRIKFDKYWEEYSLVLAIAVVLDPRFKMDLVEFYYNALYGDEAYYYIARVRTSFTNLYIEHDGEMGSKDAGDIGDNSSTSDARSQSSTRLDDFNDFDEWYKKTRSSSLTIYQKSEIDQYLDEPVFPRNDNFFILEWWKSNSPKYPTLGKMARDVLAFFRLQLLHRSPHSVLEEE